MQTEAFIGSPAERMLAADAPVRYRLDRLAPGAHRLLHELAAEGGTDYLMLPLRFSDRSRNVLAVATDRPGGFGTGDLAEFERLSHAAAAVLEIAATRRLACTPSHLRRPPGEPHPRGPDRRGGADVIHAAL
jgi:adenylate cyclase